MRILGIDPGSRVTGYGVIDVRGRDISYVASGCIRTATRSHIERLDVIGQGIRDVLDRYAPHEAAVERVFVSKNADSALKLGQARAAAICRILDFIRYDTIFEYTPRAIKQAAVGYGAADKVQIQHMIKHLLQLRGDLSSDAADALAVAVCHANSRNLSNRLVRAVDNAR
ncbi:MAG: crossover junction endodeoxyribonuclease RuvC [Gammaproteobacteria bacterium]|nr:crossover junction endodeoxyribonuclease RuvC [Gammaproteobacteria bacterium]